jgi:curved DNA-binding protein CbpA
MVQPDDFLLLGQARQPFLDPESLRAVYLARAAEAHPDTPGGDADRFAAIRKAYERLCDPAKRIRYLLELEKVPSVRASGFSAHSELFPQVARVLENVKREESLSVASRAVAILRLAPLLSEIENIHQRIKTEADALKEFIHKNGGADWKSAPVDWHAAATSLAALQKWEATLRETRFRIASRIQHLKSTAQ